MPKVEVKEKAREIRLENILLPSFDKRVVEFLKEDVPYNPSYHYYIKYHKTENNRIIGLIGLPFEVEYFETINPNEIGFAKVDIDEKEYKIIKLSILMKDFLTFYDEENDIVYYRRLFADLEKGEYDVRDGRIFNDDNVVVLRVFALDNNDNPSDDIQEIHVKILRMGGDSMPVPDIKIKVLDEKGERELNKEKRKDIVKNGAQLIVDLRNLKGEFATLRLKAFVPNVKKWWLTHYLEFKKV